MYFEASLWRALCSSSFSNKFQNNLINLPAQVPTLNLPDPLEAEIMAQFPVTVIGIKNITTVDNKYFILYLVTHIRHYPF